MLLVVSGGVCSSWLVWVVVRRLFVVVRCWFSLCLLRVVVRCVVRCGVLFCVVV